MSSQEFTENHSVAEFFVDGFAKHMSRDGVMSCVGFRNMDGRKVVVIRLAWPEVNTEAAINEALNALGTAPLTPPKPMRRRIH